MDIAVFRSGRHTDMSGRTQDWTVDDLDKIIGAYDPEHHEAPVVIGHPKMDSPAWGWVESLYRKGEILFAKLKDIAPEFGGWLADGRYKKRSIALYPDMSLKHIGFLGALPPAVKGLPDAGFSESDPEANIIEFSDREVHMEIKEFLEGLKFWEASKTQQRAEQPAMATIPGAGATFSETDMQQKITAAIEVEREKLTREFAEKVAQTKREAHHEAIRSQVDILIASGKVLPAWVKSGLSQFMAGLDFESELQFAEDGKKESQLDWFKGFLESLPQAVPLGEFATHSKEVSTENRFKQLIAQKMEKNTGMTYSQAFMEVQMEEPELTIELMKR